MRSYRDIIFTVIMSAFIGMSIGMFQIIYRIFNYEILQLLVMDSTIGIVIGTISTYSFTYFMAHFKDRVASAFFLSFVLNAVCTSIPFIVLRSLDLWEVTVAILIVEVIGMSYAFKNYRDVKALNEQLKKKQENVISTVK